MSTYEIVWRDKNEVHKTGQFKTKKELLKAITRAKKYALLNSAIFIYRVDFLYSIDIKRSI